MDLSLSLYFSYIICQYMYVDRQTCLVTPDRLRFKIPELMMKNNGKSRYVFKRHRHRKTVVKSEVRK